MAFLRLVQKVNPPDWLAMAHGFLAASAFTLLAYTMVVYGLGTLPTLGFLALVMAAVGGVAMNLGYHLAHKLIPAWMVHVHLGLAVVGTILVCWGAWSY
jgi:uncharacterized membrane-anchored protein